VVDWSIPWLQREGSSKATPVSISPSRQRAVLNAACVHSGGEMLSGSPLSPNNVLARSLICSLLGLDGPYSCNIHLFVSRALLTALTERLANALDSPQKAILTCFPPKLSCGSHKTKQINALAIELLVCSLGNRSCLRSLVRSNSRFQMSKKGSSAIWGASLE